MSQRRFLSYSIEALEMLFDEQRQSTPTLELIEQELRLRRSKRAKKLLERVVQAIGVASKED